MTFALIHPCYNLKIRFPHTLKIVNDRIIQQKVFPNCLISSFLTILVTVPTSLTTKPSDQTVIENQEVTFQCTATGNPAPNIKWIKDGQPVGNGDILSFKAKRSDSGKYWCTAENGLDVTVNASAYLDVQCKFTCHFK